MASLSFSFATFLFLSVIIIALSNEFLAYYMAYNAEISHSQYGTQQIKYLRAPDGSLLEAEFVPYLEKRHTQKENVQVHVIGDGIEDEKVPAVEVEVPAPIVEATEDVHDAEEADHHVDPTITQHIHTVVDTLV